MKSKLKELKGLTSAMAEEMTCGIGCVVSPTPSLINLASGYFLTCSISLIDIYQANQQV